MKLLDKWCLLLYTPLMCSFHSPSPLSLTVQQSFPIQYHFVCFWKLLNFCRVKTFCGICHHSSQLCFANSWFPFDSKIFQEKHPTTPIVLVVSTFYLLLKITATWVVYFFSKFYYKPWIFTFGHMVNLDSVYFFVLAYS